ncbi:MAG: hypothetical protein PVH61_14265 [Candidatus Aminicenantes bacterium]|jgi:hypothetical protein
MKIYLDQNKWIDLANSILNPNKYPKYVKVADLVKKKVNSGEWVIPISMIHFLETKSRRNNESRKKLSGVMADISKNYSIRPSMSVEPFEFYNIFAQIHSPESIIPIRAIEKNLMGAIGVKEFEMKIKGDISSVIKNKLAQVFNEKILSNEKLFALFMQHFESDNPQKNMKKEFEASKKDWEQLQIKLSTQPKEYCYKMFLIESFIGKFMKYCRCFMLLFGKSSEEFIPQDILKSEKKTINLLEAVPTLDVRIKLMYYLLRDPNRKVQLNDSKDVAFLSTAIPYTDTVITERNWKHLANQAKLGDKYSTRIENDLNVLFELER